MTELTKILKKVATFACAFASTYAFSQHFFLSSRILNSLISLLAAFVFFKQIFRYRGRPRRLSLFSESMVNGFDPQCHVPPTIINGWLYFDQMPSVQMTLRLIELHLLKFYRFTSYVTTDRNGYKVWQPLEIDNFTSLSSQYQNPAMIKPTDPKCDLKTKIFVHYASNDAEVHEIATRISNTPFQHDLRGIAPSPPWEFHHIVNVGLHCKDYDVSILPPSNISPSLATSLKSPSPYTQVELTDEQKEQAFCTQTIPFSHKLNKNDNTVATQNIKYAQFSRQSNISSHHVIVMRLDHVIGDGVALMNCFGQLFTQSDGTAVSEKMLAMMDTHNKNSKIQQSSCSSASPSSHVTPTSTKVVHSKITLLQQIPSVLRSFFSIAALATSPHDTSTSYNQIPFVSNQTSQKTALLPLYSHTREIIVVPTISLPFIKQLKDAAGVTLNDVMVCITSGGLRRLALFNESKQIFTNNVITIDNNMNGNNNDLAHPIFTSQNVLYEKGVTKNIDIICRTLLPVSFPRPRDKLLNPDTALSNQFTFLSMSFHIDIIDPIKRLRAIQSTTTALKESPDAIVGYAVTNLGTRCLPRAIAQNTAAQLFSRHSMVFSNVPGPQESIFYRQPEADPCQNQHSNYIPGTHKLIGAQMVYPNLITQCGVLSLNDCLFMNFTISIEIPNCQLLGQFVIEELAALATALQIDWIDPNLSQ